MPPLPTPLTRLLALPTGPVPREQRLVDPARCRIWIEHNRDYLALDETACADLIESFRAQGRQEVAAIVRPLTDDPDHANPNHDWEVICGARRHWTVSWFRRRREGNFAYLIEPRDLTDEEAFRLADLENRHRRDINDLERARDYTRALARHYAGHQRNMARRLNVSQAWLSRYLELARLPDRLVAALGGAAQLRAVHAARLAPLLNDPARRTALLREADLLADQQETLRYARRPPIGPAAIVRRLRQAAAGSRPRRPARGHIVRDASNTVIAWADRVVAQGLTITLPSCRLALTLPAPGRIPRPALHAALDEILDHMAPPPQPDPPPRPPTRPGFTLTR